MLPPAESLKLFRCQYSYFCTSYASKVTRTAAAAADAAEAAYVSIRLHTCIRQHTSAYVSIRQHTSAYVSRCCRCCSGRVPARSTHNQLLRCQYLYCCTSKASKVRTCISRRLTVHLQAMHAWTSKESNLSMFVLVKPVK
jgi:hypothetical protein